MIFRYQNKEWTRIPLQELPVEIKTPNIINSQPDVEAERIGKNPIPAEVIRKIVSGYFQPEFRAVLREEMKSGGTTSCPIPSSAAAKLIAPEVGGKILHYNWWPLAQDWLEKTYGQKK